jgi:hypothetical protein
MRTGILLIVLLLAASYPATLTAQGGARCGSDRWSVKTITDGQRDSVSFEAEPTTVAALFDLPQPHESRPQLGRLPLERRTFRVRAILVEQRFQSDGDIHLVLADPTDRSKMLVAEIPDSACATGTRRASDFAEARRVVNQLANGLELEVTGVAFWDDDHGQVGNAANGIELHPVLLVVPILTKNDILRMEVGADPPDTTEIRVWLNQRSRVYHCPGATAYGTTKDGEFMPESAAVKAGGRPAGGRRCR